MSTAPVTNGHPPMKPVNRWRRLLTGRGASHGAALITTPEDLEVWVTIWIAQKLAVAPDAVGRDTPFSDFGLDSMVAVEMSGKLEEVLGRPVSPSVAWEQPTVTELTTFLFSEDAAQSLDMDSWG